MKTNFKLLGLALLLSTFNFQLSTVFAQGSLAPPGAPAPAMKSLDQIEARTPISSVPFTISTPGSYYLTANLTVATGDAIVIATNNVTLDLNGFTLSSSSSVATGNAILLANAPCRDIAIFNGHIRGGVTNNGGGVYTGPGFQYGIHYTAPPPVGIRVAGVSVMGCLAHGIDLNYGAGAANVVDACVVWTVGGFGVVASTITHSVAEDCGSYAVYGDAVSDCRAETGGPFSAIIAITAQNCYGSSAGGDGLNAYAALNCFGVSTSGNGIETYTALNCYGYTSVGGNGIIAYNTATGCQAYSGNLGTGLNAVTAENCHGQSAGGYGVYATTASNCTGESDSGTGLDAIRTATGCYGNSNSGTGLYVYTGVAVGSFGHSSTGLGLKAYVANGCYGQNNSGTSEFTGNTGTDQRWNMP